MSETTAKGRSQRQSRMAREIKIQTLKRQRSGPAVKRMQKKSVFKGLKVEVPQLIWLLISLIFLIPVHVLRILRELAYRLGLLLFAGAIARTFMWPASAANVVARVVGNIQCS